MTTETRTVTLPRLLDWQRQVFDERRRFNVVCVGRRAGKTELAQDLVAETAIDGLPAAYLAPTYKMMLDVWHALRDRLAPICERISVSERRLDLITKGVVEFWSTENTDAVRGRRYARLVLDEAAQMPGLWRAFHAVLRPTLTDYVGDAWFLSTPLGRNDFWTLYNQSKADTNWRSWQMPSAVNARINTAAELEAMRLSMPERTYGQEILAQFLDDGGAVFRRVRQAATARPADPVDGHLYIFGVDWGKSEDFTVVAVIDGTTRALVAMDRFNQIDYAVQRERLGALADRYHPEAIIAESNAMGVPIIEALQRDDYPVRGFVTTNASKAAIVEGLALAFERGDLAILPDDVLIGELESYTMERTAGGLVRYTAPEGMHDDTVIALALAWRGASRIVEGPIAI